MNKEFIILTTLFLSLSCESSKDTDTQRAPIESLSEIKDTVHLLPEISIDSTLIVVDTSTGLVWMKEDFSYIKNRFLRDWNEVFEWEEEINLQPYAGCNDWRVPDISEYRTINSNEKDRDIYRQRFLQADTICIWGKGPYAFWSATTPNKNTASYISFIDGFATSGSRGKQMASGPWKGHEFGISVRLVRGDKVSRD